MMRLLMLYVPALTLTLLVGGSCASGGSRPAAAPRIVAPVMVSRFRPDFRLSPRPRDGVVLDMRVEVSVDAAGRPEMGTLRVTGMGAMENRDAVAAWLQSALFQPAQQAGRAVPGIFRERMMVRVRSRPIPK